MSSTVNEGIYPQVVATLQTYWWGRLQPIGLRAQVFYHLGELEDALTYALGAGSLFDIDEKSDYVQALLGDDLDVYTASMPVR